MCNNNGLCGCLNNNWWWIVILILLLCNCGGWSSICEKIPGSGKPAGDGYYLGYGSFRLVRPSR